MAVCYYCERRGELVAGICEDVFHRFIPVWVCRDGQACIEHYLLTGSGMVRRARAGIRC